jgi:hypothetical protein
MAKIPKRSKTPTSYVSGGTDAPQQGGGLEVGSSSYTAPRDLVPALANQAQAIRVYRQMTLEDVGVDVSLRAGKVPVLGAEFYMEPFSDSQEDMDSSEFCEFNIFDNGRPFLNVLEDILRMFEYEFSVLEEVWNDGVWAPKRSNANSKQYTMLTKLAGRPTPTIKAINYDENGGLESFTQTAFNPKTKQAKDVNIPISKAIYFEFNGKKSLLRTAYESWWYKRHFYKIDGIQKERHGAGVPDIELMPGFKEKDRIAAHELGRNLKVNEQGYIVRPPGMIVGFAELKGQLVDVLKSADHHNSMIMLNVMAQFLILGLTEGGGRATASAQTDMFQKSLKYVAELICAYFNLYLIPKIVNYNFDTNRYPKMQVRNIGESRDLQMLASAFSHMIHEGGLSLDFNTENWYRKVFDMPLISLADWTTAQAKREAAAQASPFGNGNSNNQDGTNQNGTQPGGKAGRKPPAPSSEGGVA